MPREDEPDQDEDDPHPDQGAEDFYDEPHARECALRGAGGQPINAAASADIEAHRAVVAAHHPGADPRPLERRAQQFRGNEIVDSPPDVTRPAVAHLAPPGAVSYTHLTLPT